MQDLWNVTELASLIGCHRDTVRARIKMLGIEPAGMNQQGHNLYRAGSILQLIPLNQQGRQSDPSRMDPKTRKDWYQSENERLKFEETSRHLLPADEVAREYSTLAKAMLMVLETLPDVLERDCGFTPSATTRVQEAIDDLRDLMADAVENPEKYFDVKEEDDGNNQR